MDVAAIASAHRLAYLAAGATLTVTDGAARQLAKLRPGVGVRWFRQWEPVLTDALCALPEGDLPHDVYRAMTDPTGVPKRHALVTIGNDVAAVVSLRRRRHYWEPVTNQCGTGVITPAADPPALGRALRALGLDVRAASGLSTDPAPTHPSIRVEYPIHGVDLHADYEAYWRQKNWLSSVRRARRRTADCETRVDHADDLDWTVDTWVRMWTGDREREIVAATDMARCWRAMRGRPDAPEVHTVALVHDGRPIAGAIHLVRDGRVAAQCIARDLAFEDRSTGTRIIDLSIEWARDAGHRCFELGGFSAYKRWWGPVSGTQYGAVYRPAVHDWAATALRSLRRRRSPDA